MIIDELKKNKFEVEQQLKLSQKNQPEPKRMINSKVGKNPNSESQFQEYANDLQNWKIKYMDLELAYNRMNEDKDKKIK
jgi:hypothetical protein